ncbi:MAG: nitroreductase family deazaflavin-dependent oxidoreductase [Actinomycetia bacterium]|nr:nitroreductase family deazaflavin-dependent oxidoreductase [Actinomycetes bacterium]
MSRSRSSFSFAGAGARVLRSRRLMRAPIWLYRARAGSVLGPRLLMLEHVGRNSGARRYVVLEVIEHPEPGTYVIASGFGVQSQWFRNIAANPRVRVYAGSRAPAPATARVLEPQEAERSLAVYRTKHPRAWERLKPVLEEVLGSPIDDRGTTLPMVELRLDGEAGEAG